MKIMHICTDSKIGGAIVSLYRLVSVSLREDIEHIVILAPDCVMLRAFSDLGVTVVTLSDSDRSFSIKDVFKTIYYIRRFRPDVVHTHGSVSGRIAAFICSVRSRIYTRHTYHHRGYCSIMRAINSIITTRAVAVSDALVDQILRSGITRDKISVIYNGASDTYHKNNDDRIYHLLYIGRIVKDKGLDTAISAISRLHSTDSRFTLTIVGDGSYKSVIEERISSLDTSDLVTLYPYTENTAEHLSKCGIAINCSYENEATSNFLLESMGGGLVPLVSCVGGNPIVVKDGVSGRVFAPYDVDEFISCAIDIVSRYEYYQENAYSRFLSEYTLERMSDHYIKLWEDEYDNKCK